MDLCLVLFLIFCFVLFCFCVLFSCLVLQVIYGNAIFKSSNEETVFFYQWCCHLFRKTCVREAKQMDMKEPGGKNMWEEHHGRPNPLIGSFVFIFYKLHFIL